MLLLLLLVCNKQCASPWGYACRREVALRADDQRLAEVLLLHGADPNITDSKLRTSLHYAGLHASYDMMEVLLKYNADYTAKDSTFI